MRRSPGGICLLLVLVAIASSNAAKPGAVKSEDGGAGDVQQQHSRHLLNFPFSNVFSGSDEADGYPWTQYNKTSDYGFWRSYKQVPLNEFWRSYEQVPLMIESDAEDGISDQLHLTAANCTNTHALAACPIVRHVPLPSCLFDECTGELVKIRITMIRCWRCLDGRGIPSFAKLTGGRHC